MGQLFKFLRERYLEKRCSYTSEPDDDIDRISYLPDELRVHILSFLKIKEAVHTCVLSKRWKNTWACLPILLFDLDEFLLDYPDHKLSGETVREHEDKFEKFVKAMLQNREASDLSHFVLFSVTKDCVSCNSEAFKGCILRAMEFKPRFLAIRFCKHKLPNSYDIFTCASLQQVLLGSNGVRNIEIAPNSVNLPCLKILYLAYVKVNDDFLDKLFLGCPVIEELLLLGCILNASRISSGRLKMLALLCCDFSKRLNLTLPGTEVNVHFACNAFVSQPELMINSLSNVTWLNLTLPGTAVKGLFETGVPHWPIFKNLKRLILGGWCLNSDFDLVAFFLRSPNLQSLTLHSYNPWEVADGKSNWEEPKIVMVQRERLEEVKIRKQGMSDEWVDQLKNNLHAHVKTIGEINIV